MIILLLYVPVFFLSFDKTCSLCSRNILTRNPLKVNSGPQVLWDCAMISDWTKAPFIRGNQMSASISFRDALSEDASSFPHCYCLPPNRAIANSCEVPLPLISCLEIERDALAVEWVLFLERLWTSLFFSPCLIVVDSFLLTGASKITGCLVTLFILPSLVKDSKYWSCKALVSLVGEMCLVWIRLFYFFNFWINYYIWMKYLTVILWITLIHS